MQSKYIDELILDREQARINKDWKLSDEIRNYLDSQLVFVFDTKEGQEVWYMCDKYFERKGNMSNRQYIEHRIKQDIQATKSFDAWLYSVKQSINAK